MRLDGTPHGAVESGAVQVPDVDRVVGKLDHGGRRRAGRDDWWCGMIRGVTSERYRIPGRRRRYTLGNCS